MKVTMEIDDMMTKDYSFISKETMYESLKEKEGCTLPNGGKVLKVYKKDGKSFADLDIDYKR